MEIFKNLNKLRKKELIMNSKFNDSEGNIFQIFCQFEEAKLEKMKKMFEFNCNIDKSLGDW